MVENERKSKSSHTCSICYVQDTETGASISAPQSDIPHSHHSLQMVQLKLWDIRWLALNGPRAHTQDCLISSPWSVVYIILKVVRQWGERGTSPDVWEKRELERPGNLLKEGQLLSQSNGEKK